MSANPLFEVIVWAVESAKKVNSDTITDVILHAPQYYDKWWRNLVKESPQHVLIETGLILFIIWLIFIRKTVDPAKSSKNNKLSKKEQEWLLDTWEPEPLATKIDGKEEQIANSMLVIERVDGDYLKIQGIKDPVLNVSSFDFLGLSQDSSLKAAAREALDYYGCGSCGPRGFYGTIDKHLLLEQDIAKFLGTQEAIIYSDGASAVTSTIPAYSKKGDLLIVDEAVSEPILTGVNLSRSTVHYYKHNDMNDLKNILTKVADDDRKHKRDTTQQRRFIVTEGLFRNMGDLCPLPELLALKEQFCYRLILDETLSMGTMGKTGRGLAEYYGIDRNDIEITTFTLDTTFASVGGVCTGSREIIDHQRLSGSGYCFSASAPPFLSAVAMVSLKKLETTPKLLDGLHKNAETLFNGFKTIKGLKIQSSTATPVMTLILDTSSLELEQEVQKIMFISNYCIQRGIGILANKFSLLHCSDDIRPSLTICASNKLTDKQCKQIISVLKEATAASLK